MIPVMASFDVTSLFTNVPLRETVDYVRKIVTDYNIILPLSMDLLESLILLCTENATFKFNNKIYCQRDGVAMGSPLGPVLADIFLGYIEQFILHKHLVSVPTV